MKVSLTTTPSAPLTAPLLMRGEPDEAFALAAELGYDGIELHLRRPADVDRTALLGLAATYRLDFSTLGTGSAVGLDGLTFSSPDAEVRRRAVQRIEEQIGLAGELGSAVTIGLIRGQLGEDQAERRRRQGYMLAGLEACCRAAAAAGVILLLEPINRYECDNLPTIEEARQVVEELAAPNLKLLADTYHMNIEEVDMAGALRRAGRRLGHVHLADSNRWAPGYGHIDMRSQLAALLEIDFAGYVSFECLPLPDPRRAAEDGIATVNRLLAELGAPRPQ